MPATAALNAFLNRPERERRLGPFLLIRQLGRSGVAPVWLAREASRGDSGGVAPTPRGSVAIKRFAPDAGPSRRQGDSEIDEQRMRSSRSRVEPSSRALSSPRTTPTRSWSAGRDAS